MEKVNCQGTVYFPYERSLYCKLPESVLIRELAKTPARKVAMAGTDFLNNAHSDSLCRVVPKVVYQQHRR